MTVGAIETVDIIDPWIYSVLSGDATLTGLVGGTAGIISTLAPGSVTPPYVVFFLASARDILAVGGIRVQVDSLYTVKAVTTAASWGSVRTIARRIDFLLNKPGQVVTTAAGSLSCVRESVVQYPEVDQGTQYRHAGGQYRIRASAA
jgi:hypothetical protein